MVASFHPHSMFKKVDRVTAKTGCTSCTKRIISFEVSGFHTETRLLQRDFIFLNLFELHSFHPHSMCKKVERVMAKTGCTSCTKRTISFKVPGFHPETRVLQRDFIFLTLFELLTFCLFKMHHSKPKSEAKRA